MVKEKEFAFLSFTASATLSFTSNKNEKGNAHSDKKRKESGRTKRKGKR